MNLPTLIERIASVSERGVKTIKTKLYQYFTHKDEYNYLPVIQSIAYRHKPKIKLKSFKYKIYDYLRISHLKTVFTRACDETYSGEVFRIYKRYQRETLPIYHL